MPRKKTPEKHKGVYEKIKGSGIWWIRYTDNGKRVTVSVGTHAAAVSLYEKKKIEIRTGILLTPTKARSKATFAELVEDALQFYRDSELRDVTNLTQRTNQARPEFGKRQAETITVKELQRWLDLTARERNWSGGTRNAIRASLSTVFREGMRNGKVSSNPARLLKRAKESAGRVRFLTVEEESKLREHVPPHCLPQLDIALHTGMRKSEQFSLTADQIDFAHKNIFLEKTKNGSSRYVHLNSAALKTLEDLMAERKRLGLPDNSTLFISQRFGEIKNPRKWFDTALSKAGIKGVTWHTLRHTFVSRLVMANVNLRTVQELAGHKSLAMTVRYSHLAPAHQINALELLVSPGPK